VTNTDNEGVDTEITQEQYGFQLFQRVAPNLGVRANYQYFEQTSQFEDATETNRRNREPRFDVIFARRDFSVRVSYSERTTDGSAVPDSFKSEALSASLSWDPRRGPRYQLSFRDEENISDVSVFGQNNESQVMAFEAFQDWNWGGASYSFRRNDQENRSSGFDSEQNRHEIRGYAVRRFLDGRLSTDFGAQVSRLDRDTVIDDDADLADPQPAVQGLFAVDTSPDVGELPSAPGLIDGDTNLPAAPGIDVGGANTFRNVGVDLGLKVQVSRLEVWVDSLSAANLVWEVYFSPDNLLWSRISSVTRTYDPALLRYTLDFPQHTERYFKAVNVSVNAEPLVQVTEIRALLAVEPGLGQTDIESTLYRADIGMNLQAGDKTSLRIDGGFSNDEDVAAGLTRRDFREMYAGASVSSVLTEKWRLNGGYRFSEVENRRPPALDRTEHTFNAGLNWTPLPTIDAAVTLQRREESERGDTLQTSESARIVVGTGILPDLRLTTDVALLRTNDRAAGFDREGWELRESLFARPMPRWTVTGAFARSFLETTDGERLLARTEVGASTRWLATAYFSFGGSWSWNEEENVDSTRQSYDMSYNPGPKLAVSTAYNETETEDRSTSSGSLSASYRVGGHFSFFGGASRSRSRGGAGEDDEIVSLRFGLRFAI